VSGLPAPWMEPPDRVGNGRRATRPDASQCRTRTCRLAPWVVLLAALGLLVRMPPAHGAPSAGALVLSAQAQRFLALQYRSFSTEFMGCLIGTARGTTVRVERIAPADVEPAQSASTHVVPKQSCEQAGWPGTVGVIHSHPGGERCWYYFPGTQVPTSDAQSFLHQPYPVDAIMCGELVVWISRDGVERAVNLTAAGDR
jgi:hypothetical protein